MTKDQILAAARLLDEKDRQQLVVDLRQYEGDDELAPSQLEELRRRIASLQRGETVLVDGEQVMREIREGLGMR